MDRPFLDDSFHIHWSRLTPDRVVPDITAAIEAAQSRIDALASELEAKGGLSFENTLLELEAATESRVATLGARRTPRRGLQLRRAARGAQRNAAGGLRILLAGAAERRSLAPPRGIQRDRRSEEPHRRAETLPGGDARGLPQQRRRSSGRPQGTADGGRVGARADGPKVLGRTSSTRPTIGSS